MLAVLITCHNRREKTTACLEALFRSDRPRDLTLEVHLVDDGSTDGTGEAVRAQFPQVRVHQGDGNLYWAGGMRRAWSEAAKIGYGHYLWLNDDTLIKPHALVELLNASSQLQYQAIIVGTTSALSGFSTLTYGGRTDNGEFLRPNGSLQPCRYFNGNCVLVPAAVFQKLGNLAPYYRHSFGDFDYGYRAQRAGVGQFVAPSILGSCDAHKSLPKWLDPAAPLRKRLRAFYSPLGCHPLELFHLDLVRSNLLVGIAHIFSTHLRVLFPRVWK